MPKTPLDHLEAEAKPKADITVELAGRKLTVLPVLKWKASGLRALNANDIDLWAEKCLTPESYAVWRDIDPDLEQCEEFFTAWSEATGESRPK
jgi:hypothetical protein